MKKPLLLGIILTVCIVIVTFVFAQFYPEGMISYWKFDEGSGTTALDSADANHGTFVSDPVWTSGQVGGALRFDGVDDYVDVSSVTCGGIGLTLEAWVKANDSSPNNWKGIVGGDSAIPQWQITLGQNRGSLTIWCEIQTSTGNHWLGWDTGSISTSDWTHIAMTYDGSSFTEYVNGVPGVSQPVSGTLVGWAPGWPNIGRGHHIGIGADKYLFNGAIDEVAIYNRALSATEIQQHYQDGLNGLGYEVECVIPPDGLVSWWPGDENADDIWDANHGTLWNGATCAAGRVDQAFSFDGVDDYVEIPYAIEAVDAITMDAWVYLPSLPSIDAEVISKWDGTGNGVIHFEIAPNGRVRMCLRWGGGLSDYIVQFYSTESLPINEWVHVAETWDGSKAKIYFNGVEKGSLSGAGTIRHNENMKYWIGSAYGTTRFFNGLIDEVEMFNRALPASEIQAIYNAGSAGKCKEAVVIEVDIDIKPGSYPNSINLVAHGLLPVAILGSPKFDVTTIDPGTIAIGEVTLAERGSKKAPKLAWSYEDVDGDGNTDMMTFFDVWKLVDEGVLTEGTTELSITATLGDGTPIEGKDSVNIVPY